MPLSHTETPPPFSTTLLSILPPKAATLSAGPHFDCAVCTDASPGPGLAAFQALFT